MTVTPDVQPLSLDERRFLAEEENRRSELRLRERELEIRREESQRSGRSQFSGVATAVIAGAMSLVAAGVTSYLSGFWSLKAQKAQDDREFKVLEYKTQSDVRSQEQQRQAEVALKERERQFDIVLKATEDRTPEEAARNLVFFVEIGFLPDPDGKIRAKAAAGDVPTITSSATNASPESRVFPGTPRMLPSERYEGKRSLGNTQQGDGLKFLGRGYLMITGRNQYTMYAALTGLDLVNDPTKAESPEGAATILAAQFKERESAFVTALEANDFAKARRLIAGGTVNRREVEKLFRLYRMALESAGSETRLDIPQIDKPEWLSVHVPAILTALRAKGINNANVQAYALATADFETARGRYMKEPNHIKY